MVTIDGHIETRVYDWYDPKSLKAYEVKMKGQKISNSGLEATQFSKDIQVINESKGKIHVVWIFLEEEPTGPFRNLIGNHGIDQILITD